MSAINTNQLSTKQRSARQRNANVQGQNRRKKTKPSIERSWALPRWLKTCAVTLVLCAGVGFITFHVKAAFLEVAARPIAAVQIAGELNRVSKEDLQKQLAPVVTQNFLQLDLLQVKRELETHPWIAEVTLSRRWPDRLYVELVEETAIARWRDSSFLNQSGKEIAIGNNYQLAHLPKLSGPAGTQLDMARKYVEINGLLKPLQVTVSQLDLSDDLTWSVTLDNGLGIALGRDELLVKIERFVSVYEAVLSPRLADINQVDMRYRNGLAVRWAEQALTAAN